LLVLLPDSYGLVEPELELLLCGEVELELLLLCGEVELELLSLELELVPPGEVAPPVELPELVPKCE